MAGKIEGKRRRGAEDKMFRQHHRLNGHEFEESPGGSGGQGSQACYSPWGHRVFATEREHPLLTDSCLKTALSSQKPFTYSFCHVTQAVYSTAICFFTVRRRASHSGLSTRHLISWNINKGVRSHHLCHIPSVRNKPWVLPTLKRRTLYYIRALLLEVIPVCVSHITLTSVWGSSFPTSPSHFSLRST